jgi:UDP-N-acetylglucosamine--N-acetylmuramyl-(pentapeptide) pyrophosphoryl-undecaprenol N-acetylglucosamine transferase
MADRNRLAQMSAATLGTGRREADEILARSVLEVIKK